jgi:hypothetical protein
MNKQAQPGNVFVLTEKGYKDRLPVDDVNIGESFPEYEDYCPESWIENGWVKEKEVKDE